MVEKALTNVITITKEAQYDKCVKENKSVIAHFNNQRLSLVKKFIPMFHELAKKNSDIIVLDIDVVDNLKLSEKYQEGTELPYIILYSKGQRIIGFNKMVISFCKEQLQKMLPTINLEGFGKFK